MLPDRRRITHEDTLRLHKIIAGKVMHQGEAGRYRTIRVRVGDYLPDVKRSVRRRDTGSPEPRLTSPA